MLNHGAKISNFRSKLNPLNPEAIGRPASFGETAMTVRPPSLLDIVNAPQTPSPLASSALVLIDAQEEYRRGRLKLDGIELAIAEAARLLDLARRAGLPVFHIVQHARPGSPIFNPEGPMIEIFEALGPQPGERVVVKSLPNAFAKTDLHELIAGTGRRELIIAGFMTHMCVSATARAATDLGYRNTVIAHATATRDLPDPLGGVIPAGTVKRAALAMLADRFAIVVPDSGALAAAQSSPVPVLG
jgi:nicotinamidase-related amidase